MGFLQRLSTVVPPARMRADAGSASAYNQAFFSGADLPNSWVSSLSAAGINVTPDLAMSLSAMYCGVTTICYDLATLPALTFKNRDDGGKDLVVGRSANYMRGGIGDLAYMLRWAPNQYQTATEYFGGQIAQFLLRGKAYAEIVDGPSGFLEQLLPRHPDRVTPERLPNGNIRYKLMEANGQARYVTQEEMHVVRDISSDSLNSLSRISYGASALGSALAAERAAGKFFKSGMTAATIATYKGGQMEQEEEEALHAGISRYAAGVENSFGLMLIPDDVTISNLGVEPDKAQMMLAREWGINEVARLLRIQPRKLMAGKTATYASAYQDAIDHVVNCIRPTAVTFEQAVQRDLILAKDTYQMKFRLRELLQGDPTQMGAFIQQLIVNRVMTPSEVRMTFMDLNPDSNLDKLSEGDNRPGTPAGPATPAPTSSQSARAALKATFAVHANAVRCLRRERAAVEKLAKKHANDVDGWRTGLRSFFADHAAFVAATMSMDLTIARGYAAQHGSVLESKGVVMMEGDAGEAWERYEADELAALALADGPSAERWFIEGEVVDARP